MRDRVRAFGAVAALLLEQVPDVACEREAEGGDGAAGGCADSDAVDLEHGGVDVTTIAWDGKTLVGDRLRTVGNTPMNATKVFRADGNGKFGAVLYGASGDSWECAQFRDWMEGLVIERPSPKNICFVIISRDGRCWFGGEALLVHEVPMPYWAIGSGCEYALGAMAAGKSAREAVEIAAEFDVHTGLGVDVLEFQR